MEQMPLAYVLLKESVSAIKMLYTKALVWWRWRYRLLRWNLTKRYISTIFVYTLSWRNSNINRPNKRKWFRIKKKARIRWYPAEIMADANDLTLLANPPAQEEFILQRKAARGIDLYVNANKTGYTCFKQKGGILTLINKPLKLMDPITYLSSDISSTESNVSIRLVRAWNAIDRLSVIWKSDLSDKIKQDYFQVTAVSILHSGCTNKMHRKKLDGNYTRLLGAYLEQILEVTLHNTAVVRPLASHLTNHSI